MRDPPEGPEPADAEAARHLLLRRVGVAKAGGHGKVHERIDRERHDQHGATEAGDTGGQRVPAEADHEVGDRKRYDDEHRPQLAAGKVGALDAPSRGSTKDSAERGDDDGQPDRVPEQLGSEVPQQQVSHLGRARVVGEDDQEDAAGARASPRPGVLIANRVRGACALRCRSRATVGRTGALIATSPVDAPARSSVSQQLGA